MGSVKVSLNDSMIINFVKNGKDSFELLELKYEISGITYFL